MASELFCLGPDHADGLDLFGLDNPCHGRDVVGNAAVNFALEAFDNLGSADFPPLLCGGDLLSCIGLEDLRQYGERIGLAFVVVGGVRTALVCVKGVSDGLDAQLVKHVLVVLLGCESHRLLRIGSRTEQACGD